MLQGLCGGQRTTLWRQSSPSTFMRLLGMELGSTGCVTNTEPAHQPDSVFFLLWILSTLVGEMSFVDPKP